MKKQLRLWKAITKPIRMARKDSGFPVFDQYPIVLKRMQDEFDQKSEKTLKYMEIFKKAHSEYA